MSAIHAVTTGWETMLVVEGRELPIACTTTCNWCPVVGLCSASCVVADTIGVARQRRRTTVTFNGALPVDTTAGPCCYCPVGALFMAFGWGPWRGWQTDGPSGLAVEVPQATRERHCLAPRCTVYDIVRAMHSECECTALCAPPTLCLCLAGICFVW